MTKVKEMKQRGILCFKSPILLPIIQFEEYLILAEVPGVARDQM